MHVFYSQPPAASPGSCTCSLGAFLTYEIISHIKLLFKKNYKHFSVEKMSHVVLQRKQYNLQSSIILLVLRSSNEHTCYETKAPKAPFGAVQVSLWAAEQAGETLPGARCCPQKLLQRAWPRYGGCSRLQPERCGCQLWELAFSKRFSSFDRLPAVNTYFPGEPWLWACSSA